MYVYLVIHPFLSINQSIKQAGIIAWEVKLVVLIGNTVYFFSIGIEY